MANTIEIILQAIDKASDIIRGVEQKTTTANESISKSFEGVGFASSAVDKKLGEYGAAVDAVTRQQNQLKQAQLEAQEAAQKLAQAQKNLADNTDPSKTAALNRELVNAQVQLDKAGKEVQDLSKSLRDGKSATDEAKSGFSNLQSAIVTVNQGMQLVSQVANQVSRAYDETIGKTLAYAKEVRDLSTNLGISAEETSKIIQAADDYGISVEAVTGALQMAVKRGFSPSIETLAKLADEYNNIASPTERAARLADVFGRGWTTLTPILKAGGQAIREAAGEAEKLGLVISEKDVQNARALEVQIDNLNDRIDALKLKMGKDLIPGLVVAAEDFTRLGDKIMGTSDPLDEAKLTYDRIVKAFGEGSAAANHARDEYEKLKKAEDDQVKAQQDLERQLGRTNKEHQLQLAMLPPALNGYADSTQAILDEDQAMKQYNDTLEKVTAARRTSLIETTALAIQYTEAQKKQADVQAELDKLNQQIASHGAARTVSIKNEKLSADDLAKAQAGLAVAQEDLSSAQRKAGETAAEFALRVETLKGKVSDYNQKLGEHTAVVGGATKAEQEQKKALEEQIAALQKSSEIDRAKGAFESLTTAFRDGTLTEAQYTERAAALNEITHLYSASALETATRQETLMKSFADSRSEDWRSQLIRNKDAIDGVVDSTQKAIDTTDKLKNVQSEAAKAAPARGEARAEKAEIGGRAVSASTAAAQANLDFIRANEAAAKSAQDAIEKTSAAQEKASREAKGRVDVVLGAYSKVPPAIAPKIDTTQAAKDIQAFTTDKVGAIPATKKTTAVFDSIEATRGANDIIKLFNTIPPKKDTVVNVDGKVALQVLDDIRLDLDGIFSKTIEILVKYKTEGNRPSGFQRGIDMIVPPSPTGRTGDYFPFLAAAGERVTVQTPAQQMTPNATPGGDTYIYNTNVYNPLAAAMLADRQRRDRLARSNSRMGVI